MSKITIREISKTDGKIEQQFLSSFPETENGFERPGKGFDLSTQAGFVKFIQNRIDLKDGAGLKDGYVPQTTFWILSDNQLAGIAKARHYLNDTLMQHGGHIGLAISSNFRGQNVGTEALELLINYVRSLGQDKILITNNETNLASRKISEKNGGKLWKIENGTSYYWI